MARKPKNDFTHDQLAQRLGKDRTYITKVLNGSRTPPIELAIAIFDQTGLKIGQLKAKNADQIAAIRAASNLLAGVAA